MTDRRQERKIATLSKRLFIAKAIVLGIATGNLLMVHGQVSAEPQFADRMATAVPAPRFVTGDMINGGLTKCGKLILPPGARAPNRGPGATAGAVPLGLANSDLDVAAMPRFDTASVKTVSGGRPASTKSTATRIEYSNFRLSSLILRAYPVAECQVLWPSWLQYDLYYGWPGNNVGDDRVPGGMSALMDRFGPFFDVTGTFPGGTTEEQQQLMLRALLADRFKLTLHRQTVDLPVYSVTAKHSRMVAVSPPKEGNESWESDVNHHWAVWDLSVGASSSGMRISHLLQGVNSMIYELDRPMVDRTGLDGYYAFHFSMPRDPVTTARDAFDAMKKQLGLVVEEETLRTEMLVIDHVEKGLQ